MEGVSDRRVAGSTSSTWWRCLPCIVSSEVVQVNPLVYQCGRFRAPKKNLWNFVCVLKLTKRERRKRVETTDVDEIVDPVPCCSGPPCDHAHLCKKFPPLCESGQQNRQLHATTRQGKSVSTRVQSDCDHFLSAWNRCCEALALRRISCEMKSVTPLWGTNTVQLDSSHGPLAWDVTFSTAGFFFFVRACASTELQVDTREKRKQLDVSHEIAGEMLGRDTVRFRRGGAIREWNEFGLESATWP